MSLLSPALAGGFFTASPRWEARQYFTSTLLPFMGFPDGSEGSESACNARDPGSIPGSGRSPGKGNSSIPLQYSCLENFLWSLEGYNPWGCKLSDTTFFLFISVICLTSCYTEHVPWEPTLFILQPGSNHHICKYIQWNPFQVSFRECTVHFHSKGRDSSSSIEYLFVVLTGSPTVKRVVSYRNN